MRKQFKKIQEILIPEVEIQIINASDTNQPAPTLIVVDQISEKVYNEEHITAAFEILRASASGENRKSCVSQFYGIRASLMNIIFPLSAENFRTVNNIIPLLPRRNICVAESREDVRGQVNDNEYDWVIFVPIDASDSAYEAIERMEELLPENDNANTKVKWIVGRYCLNYNEAPLLFAFSKGTLKAVCFDAFDIWLLSSEMEKSNVSSSFALLAPTQVRTNCLYPNRLPYAVDVVQKYCKLDNQSSSVLKAFSPVENIGIDDARTLLREIIKVGYNESRIVLCIIDMILNIDDKSLQAIVTKYRNKKVGDRDSEQLRRNLQDWMVQKTPFLKHVYKAIENLTKESNYDCVEWNVNDLVGQASCPSELKQKLDGLRQKDGVLDCLRSYISQVHFDKPSFHVNAIVSLLDKVHDGGALIKLFCKRILFKNLSFSTLNVELSDELNLHRLSNLLCRVNEEDKLIVLQQLLYKFDKTCISYSVASIIREMRISNLSEKQWTELWEHPKFCNVIRAAIEDASVQDEIRRLFTGIPNNILPSEFNKVLKLHQMGECTLSIENWSNEEEAREDFQEIFESGILPNNFMNVLRKSVQVKPHFLHIMNEMGALIFYVGSDNDFSEPWNMTTICEALEKMKNYTIDAEKQKEIDTLCGAKISIPDPEYDNFKETCPNTNRPLEINEKWLPLVTDSRQLIQVEDYLEVRDILPEPEVLEDELGGISKIFKYVLQRIKLWGYHAVLPTHLSQLIKSSKEKKKSYAVAKRGSLPDHSKNSTSKTFPLSRVDFLTYLIAHTSSIVAQDIFRILSQFPTPLPLITQGIGAFDSHTCNISLLQCCQVKWQLGSDKVYENNLFEDPFYLIVALRLGDNHVGKSTILNKEMEDKYCFSTRGEPGGKYGKPVSLDGFVELVWLTKETCSEMLWTTVVQKFYEKHQGTVLLLANLHGDALKHQDVLETLWHLASAFIVFKMPNCGEQTLDFEDNVLEVFIDPPENLKINYDGAIQTGSLDDDSTLENLRDVINEATDFPRKPFSFEKFSTQCSLRLSGRMETTASQELICFVKEKTVATLKSCLKLQCSQKDQFESIWETTENLRAVIIKMANVLALPLESRDIAMTHVNRGINKLAHEACSILKKQLVLEKSALMNSSSNARKLAVTKINHQLDNLNLGLEHILREIGRLYEVVLHNPNDPINQRVLEFPNQIGELFLRGHAIELLDGDNHHIAWPLLNAIVKYTTTRFPVLRVFVLSIIGAQSSGKSTLLNALFASKFSVSVGRCTRGLFMRLIFLEPNLKRELNVDAIIVIDSEGLCAAEKINDEKAEKSDRLLATLAMTMSDLTLLNIQGESMNSLTEILQIVIVTIARLEEVQLQPDILVVQHLPEKNEDKLSTSRQEFCNALTGAINLTDKNEVVLGIQNSQCLKNLVLKIENKSKDLMTSFRPLRHGATAGSPPSKEYHEDIIQLLMSIFKVCKQSVNKPTLEDWMRRTESLFNCIEAEDFSVRFKNIHEMNEFVRRNKDIGKFKQAVDSMFREHRLHETSNVRSLFNTTLNPSNVERKEISRRFTQKFEEVCEKCNRENPPCKPCSSVMQSVETLKEHAKNTNSQQQMEYTIDTYIINSKHENTKELVQIYITRQIQKGYAEELNDIIDSHMNNGNVLNKKLSITEITDLENKIWDELKKRVQMNVEMVSAQRRVVSEIQTEYALNSNFRSRVAKGQWGVLKNDKVEKTLWNFRKTVDETPVELRKLKDKLIEDIDKIIKEYDGGHYQTGMVRSLKNSVEKTLIDFKRNGIKKKIDDSLVWDAHLYAVQKFKANIVGIQKDWDIKHNPGHVLIKQRRAYNQIIQSRLKCGLGVQGEGTIVANLLLTAIQRISESEEFNTRKELLLKCSWTKSTEQVRLRFFMDMLNDCKQQKFDLVLQYSKSPKTTLKTWYKLEVDKCGNDDSHRRSVYQDAFQTELKRLIYSINNCKDMDYEGIKSILNEYFHDGSGFGVHHRWSKKDSDLRKNVSLFITTLISELKASENKFLTTSIDYKMLSTDDEVKKRLGCTAMCPHCSSICWGHFQHKFNKDESKLHYSCHQPHGLVGTTKKLPKKHLYVFSTYELEARTCVQHGWNKSGEPLVDINQMDSNWKYTVYSQEMYDKLMQWLFRASNIELAKKYGCNEASSQVLKSLGYNDIDTGKESIMTLIKQRISD